MGIDKYGREIYDMYENFHLTEALTTAYATILGGLTVRQSNTIRLDKIHLGTHAAAAMILHNLEPIGFIRARYGENWGDVDYRFGPTWHAYWAVWDSQFDLEEL